MKKDVVVITGREMAKLLKLNTDGVNRRIVRGEIPEPNAHVINRGGGVWTLDYLRQSRPDLAEQVDKRLAA